MEISQEEIDAVVQLIGEAELLTAEQIKLLHNLGNDKYEQIKQLISNG